MNAISPRAAMLPPLRGRVQEAAPLAPFTWFRVGGPAEYLVRPADLADLCLLLRDLPHTVPVRTLGAASNLIIRDGGLNGVAVKLARGFGAVTVEGDTIIAGAAALDTSVAEHAAAAGIAGLEFLCGIPGTIGGAVAMNAGAYGSDIAAVLVWAEMVTRGGDVLRLQSSELHFGYRASKLPADAVVVRACLRGQPGEASNIAARMAQIRTERDAAQPTRARTGGSTFRNPANIKAWELIDAAGCRGLTFGGAQVSEKHCNFLLNTGGATAADLEALGESVRARVLAHSGVPLTWEILRVGLPSETKP
jgi:UDP-N-acetylmuramate dehydrogenase